MYYSPETEESFLLETKRTSHANEKIGVCDVIGISTGRKNCTAKRMKHIYQQILLEVKKCETN